MKATIVIPNINGKGWLKDSIESIYAQTEQDFELIIVDNGSTDESLEQARSYCGRPNFTLIENGTNTGFSHAVNQGIARAKGEYVVMFNNDAFAEPEWLAELIRTAETDLKIFAVQSLMLRHFERELADDAGDYVTWMGFACKTGDGRRASRYTKQKRIFSACVVGTPAQVHVLKVGEEVLVKGAELIRTAETDLKILLCLGIDRLDGVLEPAFAVDVGDDDGCFHI